MGSVIDILQPQGVRFKLFRANSLTQHGSTCSIGIFRLRAHPFVVNKRFCGAALDFITTTAPMSAE